MELLFVIVVAVWIAIENSDGDSLDQHTKGRRHIALTAWIIVFLAFLFLLIRSIHWF